LKMNLDLRSLYKCVRCGTCRSVCPVFEQMGWESFNTRGRILVIKSLQEGAEPDLDVLDRLNTCTTCGICTENCPAGVNPPLIVQDARRELSSLGIMTEAQALLCQNVNRCGNVFGGSGDRLGWLSDRSHLEKKADYVYFAGCLDSYRYPDIAAKTFEILRRFGVTVLPDEQCCGSPLLRTGSDASKSMERNLEQIKDVGAHTVITGCAGCYTTLKKDYPSEFDVVSVPEFLADRISELDLAPLDMTVTYHDPCHLGRHNGIYEEPRRIIKAICNFEEMKANRERSPRRPRHSGFSCTKDRRLQCNLFLLERPQAAFLQVSKRYHRSLPGHRHHHNNTGRVVDIAELVFEAISRPTASFKYRAPAQGICSRYL